MALVLYVIPKYCLEKKKIKKKFMDLDDYNMCSNHTHS